MMWRARSALPLLTAVLVACGDDPTGPTRQITLSFCSNTSWAGVQNEGQDWVTIANGPADATFEASERLIVATITGSALTFYHLTSDQAEATFSCSARGTKELTGSVTGTTGLARVTIGTSSGGTGTLFTTYTLTNVPDGPLDLVATSGNRAILRRAVNYPNGSTIPVLDFSSSEAFALESHPLGIELNGLGFAQWATEIITSRGTYTYLSNSGPPCCVVNLIFTLPAIHQQSGDLYRLVVGGGSGGNGRMVERYFATPSSQVIVFGPAANKPTFTRLETAGQLWRAEIVSQPEYGSHVELTVEPPQPTTNTTSLVIKGSKEYFGGTPATWSFTVPDLSGVEGFPSGWPKMPTPGAGHFTATDAPWGFSVMTARAGDEYRSASSF